MDTDRTAEQWLAEQDLPTELAKALTPGPWKHDIYNSFKHGSLTRFFCTKCGNIIENVTGEYMSGVPGRTVYESDDPCPVPDPITIDWNTAKFWQGKCEQEAYIQAAIAVYEELYPDKLSLRKRVYCWLASLCKPEDAKLVIVIAAMAAGSKE